MKLHTLTYDKTNEIYSSHTGYIMRREGDGGKWVLRGKDGQHIDTDMYRQDLVERNNIALEHI